MMRIFRPVVTCRDHMFSIPNRFFLTEWPYVGFTLVDFLIILGKKKKNTNNTRQFCLVSLGMAF